MSPAKRISPAKGSDAKKQKRSPLDENLAVLTSAFNNSEYEFPCVESLKTLIPNTLSTPVERRHEYQTKVFNMVEEAVREAQCSLEMQLKNFQTEVTESDKLQQEMETSVVETEENIKTQEEQVSAMTTCVQEATARLTDGQSRLDAELESLENERVDYDQHQSDFEELNSKFVELFLEGALMTSHARAPTNRKSLEKLIKTFITVDDSTSPVIQSAFAALCQEPKMRSAFDKHTLDLFEDIFENKLSDIRKEIVRTKPDFSKRDALQQEVENLTEVLEGEQEKLNVAKDAHKKLLTKLKTLKKDLKSHPQRVEYAQDSLASTTETLDVFKNVVVPANRFIQEYTEVVPVPVEEPEKVCDVADVCAPSETMVVEQVQPEVAEEMDEVRQPEMVEETVEQVEVRQPEMVDEEMRQAEVVEEEMRQTEDISMSTPEADAEPTSMDAAPLENAAFNTPRDTMKHSQPAQEQGTPVLSTTPIMHADW